MQFKCDRRANLVIVATSFEMEAVPVPMGMRQTSAKQWREVMWGGEKTGWKGIGVAQQAIGGVYAGVMTLRVFDGSSYRSVIAPQLTVEGHVLT